jgi:hypothetical protein
MGSSIFLHCLGKFLTWNISSSVGGHLLIQGDLVLGGVRFILIVFFSGNDGLPLFQDLHIRLPGQNGKGILKTSINPEHPSSLEQVHFM